MLLEDFKQCLPVRMVWYLNEQEVITLSQAAVLADEFVQIHKNVFQTTGIEISSVPKSAVTVQPSKLDGEQSKETRECFYCRKRGHVIDNCLTLKERKLHWLTLLTHVCCLNRERTCQTLPIYFSCLKSLFR